ncbi:methylmalonyl-CoA mutase family protein, partial [Nostoc sp. NIES-2111]
PALPRAARQAQIVLPADRTNYLAEIADLNRMYREFVEAQAGLASKLYRLQGAIEALEMNLENEPALRILQQQFSETENRMDGECRMVLRNWKYLVAKYEGDNYEYKVRDKVIQQSLVTTTLSGTRIRKVALPKFNDWGDILRWRLLENVPGKFPYAAGVFPLKREGEDPTRMFAGEGNAERTNRRFHYVSQGMPAKRLSTAFDSVTLYGEDPGERPDIYGKIGNSGVSISTVDDAKRLYSGFDLCAPSTSVSMTINGPAPIVLAFFLNAAIDQQVEKHLAATGRLEQARNKIAALYEQAGLPVPTYDGALPEGNDGLGLALLGISGDEVLPADEYEKIRAATLNMARGTVQADILKEDQAQNTCIFSTEFALRMMGDIQQYFIDKQVRNFYSVSISGYHIAEAGANPITQLALTLANGFTYVEYYLSRGMHIDDFAPNLSFFFSNGTDTEYAVIGRVARRIWAKAIKHRYKGNDRSQKLKYHIQTSGRSLHAQEIAFNDIRTTLQALYAIYDNCNSLHTNAYDEAITTPTEESVRRAMAIQLILNKEFGMNLNENVMQGSFIMEELADLVEEAVLSEFRRLSDRGGVLGAMERMYQRNKIQDESLLYETLKHEGKIQIVGVNTFLDKKGSPTIIPEEVIRSTEAEKALAIRNNESFKTRNPEKGEDALKRLQSIAAEGGNIFAELMETVKYCSLGQISNALYQVGGQYRRNM